MIAHVVRVLSMCAIAGTGDGEERIAQVVPFPM
jgi:hypothetical protein